MEMRKLKKMGKILIIISIVILLFCVVGAYAKDNDIESINWNVTEGLTKTSGNSICVTYEAGDFKFRIFTRDNDDDLAKYKKGFEKDNETGMYYRFDVDAVKMEHSNSVGGSSDALYGEYVKMGDKKYWVEAHQSSVSVGDKNDVVNDLGNPNLSKLKGYLTYFNEHNDVTIIDV